MSTPAQGPAHLRPDEDGARPAVRIVVAGGPDDDDADRPGCRDATVGAAQEIALLAAACFDGAHTVVTTRPAMARRVVAVCHAILAAPDGGGRGPASGSR